MTVLIRAATPDDVPQILELIQGLAEYERLRHECVATEASLHATLFGEQRYAEVIMAELNKTVVGFALFFHNYSTFLAQPGIYLEDLFVRPEWRGRGVGKVLLQYLAALSVARHCGRLEWSVLNWNSDAIGFYRSLGAVPQEEWSVYRLTGDALTRLATSTP